jgi:hypothetical protein
VSTRASLLLQSAHRPAIIVAASVLGTALLLAIGLVGWSSAGLREARGAQQIGRMDLASTEQFAEELVRLQAELPQREAESIALKAGGFLALTDRVGWAESVATEALELRPLNYAATIGTTEWLPLPDDLSAWYANQGRDAPALHATELALQVQGLHEDELSRLLRAALGSGGGVTRIEHCQLARRTDGVGLDVECRLRRYGLGMPPVEDVEVLP